MELAEEYEEENKKEIEKGNKKWPEESRQRAWLPLDKAKQKATFPETGILLEKASKQLKSS